MGKVTFVRSFKVVMKKAISGGRSFQAKGIA